MPLLLPVLAVSLVLSTPFDTPSAAVTDARNAKRPELAAEKADLRQDNAAARGRTMEPDALAAISIDTDEAAASSFAEDPSASRAYLCPSGMVMVGRSYCIDAYEASLVEVMPRDSGATTRASERSWPYFEQLRAGVHVRAVSVPGVFPQGYVSGLQARDACEASGKRLCTPDEWKNACMGPDKTAFPYGNERVSGRCNDNGRSSMHLLNPELDDKPEHRWMWGFGGNMTDPRLNQVEGTLTRTGEREGCTNAYGVFDMVGNLHEWVDDPDGTFQGGYYLDTHINGDGCNYRTTAHPMSHLDYSTGFRCCSDAPAL